MVAPATLHDSFLENEISFYAGVPDSLLEPICSYIAANVSSREHIVAVNEGAAVALAVGHHLATGGIPLVYLQNSGLGNAVNPLMSLADPAIYSIPMVLMIGWRGQPGFKDEPQHQTQGRVMLAMLEAMDIPHAILPADESAAAQVVSDIVQQAKNRSGPVALVVPRGIIEPYGQRLSRPDAYELSREQAIIDVLDALGDAVAVVGTTGMASREIFEYRLRNGKSHQQDFLTVGGMGHASQIALALSIERPERSVFCLDGDGAVLMHMGALATNAKLGGANFHHIVLNNGAHDSVGGQPTISLDINLTGIAQSAGYSAVLTATTGAEIRDAVSQMLDVAGPSFLEIRVRCGSRKDLGRPSTTPQENKQALMTFLGAPAPEAGHA